MMKTKTSTAIAVGAPSAASAAGLAASAAGIAAGSSEAISTDSGSAAGGAAMGRAVTIGGRATAAGYITKTAGRTVVIEEASPVEVAKVVGGATAEGGGVTATSDEGGDRELSDYFSELLNIERLKATRDRSNEELSRTPDEAEQEMGWLEDAGFGHLVSKYKDGILLTSDVVSKETSELTDSEAAVVKKRIDTLNSTLRKRRKQQQRQELQQNKTHVKDVFKAVDVREQSVRSKGTNSSARRNGSRSLKIEKQEESAESSSSGGQYKPSAHRSSLLRSRGEYSMSTGHTGSAVDSMYSRTGGIEALKFRSTNRDLGGRELRGSRPATVGGGSTAAMSQRFSDQLIAVLGSEPDSNALPDLLLSSGSHGVTYTSDLGSEDLKKIKSLALIELTSFYDSHGITLSRGKSGRSRISDSGVFGVPLYTLLEYDQKKHSHLRVPLIFCELVKHLERTSLDEEGLLRVPGSVTRMKTLQHELDSAYKRGKDLRLDEISPHDAAGLLKQLLRDLPSPLLTSEYLEAFLQVDKMQELRQKLEALNLLILLLPSVNRDTLELILNFLQQVISNEYNKMTMKSVAMIMAPNLFCVRTPRSGITVDREVEIGVAARTSSIVLLIIKYQRILWAVPEFLLFRIRGLYQNNEKRPRKARALARFLGMSVKSTSTSNGRHSTAKPSEAAQAPVFSYTSTAGMIRITAPQLSKFNTTLQLDDNLTAGDVLARFAEPTQGADSNRDSASEQPNSAADSSSAAAEAARTAGTSAGFYGNSSSKALADADEGDNTGRVSLHSQDGSTYNHSSGSGGSLTRSATEAAARIHLYEIGGNIGERRLDSGANMLSLYHINPRAEWVVRRDVVSRPT